MRQATPGEVPASADDSETVALAVERDRQLESGEVQPLRIRTRPSVEEPQYDGQRCVCCREPINTRSYSVRNAATRSQDDRINQMQ